MAESTVDIYGIPNPSDETLRLIKRFREVTPNYPVPVESLFLPKPVLKASIFSVLAGFRESHLEPEVLEEIKQLKALMVRCYLSLCVYVDIDESDFKMHKEMLDKGQAHASSVTDDSVDDLVAWTERNLNHYLKAISAMDVYHLEALRARFELEQELLALDKIFNLQISQLINFCTWCPDKYSATRSKA